MAATLTPLAASAADTTVLLEDSWEAEDVIEECARRGLPCRELTVDELKAHDARTFVLQSIFMCSTEIVQAKLREVSAGLGADVVPDTYPGELQDLLRRDVARRTLGSVSASELPIFVKPASNDKAFDGRVVRDAERLAELREEVAGAIAEEHLGSGDQPTDFSADDTEVYVAPPVHFRAEFRLFVGAGRIYRGAEDESYQIRCDADKEAEVLKPPGEFVAEVLRACPADAFWAVDVGLMAQATMPAQWAVVEVNPPFSLDDHGLPIGPYVDYCADACAWIRAKALQHIGS